MRNPGINPTAASVFKDVTDDEIKAQIKELLEEESEDPQSCIARGPRSPGPAAGLSEGVRQTAAADQVSCQLEAAARERIHRPTTGFDAAEWGKKHYEAWGKSLDYHENDAIAQYTGNGYVEINRWLRDPGSPSPSARVERVAGTLEKILDRQPAPEGVIAYRQYSLSDQGLARHDIKPGMDLGDAGFTSTTLKPGGVWHGDLLEVRTPKGASAHGLMRPKNRVIPVKWSSCFPARFTSSALSK